HASPGSTGRALYPHAVRCGLALGCIDDIVGCGPEEAVRECFAAIKESAQGRGLTLQLHKCSVFRPSGAAVTQLPPAVGIESDGLTVLGVPLGVHTAEDAGARGEHAGS